MAKINQYKRLDNEYNMSLELEKQNFQNNNGT